MKRLSIYIHIPFCLQKCRYCDFLSARADAGTKDRYVEELKKEIISESVNYKDYIIDTVFFGGGTPSILKGEVIADIMDILKKHYQLNDNPEITIEMNPATADEEKMRIIKNAGVNRLSIGLQSTNDEELRMLGRIHSFQDFLFTYNTARKCGFDNINIDLMSALPGQTFDSYIASVKKVLELKPEHISAYSLIIEEGTYLCENIDSFPPIPSEEEDRKMYQETKNLLEQAGFHRYEISNYARDNFECSHNKVYWERGNYVGFGLGAASMVDNVRWKNVDALSDYYSSNKKTDIEKLEIQDQMEEFMFLGLRMVRGISKKSFHQEFKKDIDEVYGKTIQKWVGLGFLLEDDTSVSFTEKGLDVSNQILAEFLF